MVALVAAVAVHPVRVDHQFELGAGLLQGIGKHQGVLEMDIVVTGAVSQLQHHRTVI